MVQLLKESLGESLIKKSVEVWNYKHVKNPFGPSHVLLAEKEEQLIGLRAFMSWKWQQGENIWQAWRAVDTATHPQHQGKGIFRTLTMQALEEVAAQEPCFIFNTPNEKAVRAISKWDGKPSEDSILPSSPRCYTFFTP
jgi:GNAT superfamily N-acetyltransferase